MIFRRFDVDLNIAVRSLNRGPLFAGGGTAVTLSVCGDCVVALWSARSSCWAAAVPTWVHPLCRTLVRRPPNFRD